MRGKRRLTQAYLDAMDAPVSGQQETLLQEMRAHILATTGAEKLTAAELIGIAMVQVAADPTSKSGVWAARELADRTEGPVAQMVMQSSTTYVVEVPAYKPDGTALTPEEWAAQFAAQPATMGTLLPPQEPATSQPPGQPGGPALTVPVSEDEVPL